MSTHQGRWLTALATVPTVLITLATAGPLSVQAATAGTAPSSASSLDPSGRFELGLAMVAFGLLALAVTIVRLRIQNRQRRSPALVRSSGRKVTDTWASYATAARHPKSAASRW